MRSLLPLLLSVVLITLGQGLLNLLVAVRLDAEGKSALTIGAVMACFYVGQIIAAVAAPWVVLRVGHVRAYAAFASLVAVTALGHALAGPWAWAALRAADGLCLSAAMVVLESWMNEQAGSQRRGTVLALYLVCFYAALGGGQLLVGVAPTAEPTLFIVAALLVSLAVVPVATTTTEAPAAPHPEFYDLRELAANAPLAIASLAASGLVLGSFFALGPLFVAQSGLQVAEIGQVMGAAIIGGLLLQWPLGFLSDLMDRRSVMLGVGALLVPTSLAVLFTASKGVVPLAISLAIFGGVATTLYPLAIAHVADRVPSRHLVAASATSLMVNAVASIVGPLLVSVLMVTLWPGALFGASAMIGAWLAGLVGWRMSMKHVDEPGRAYVALPPTTPSVSDLDPRIPLPADDEAAG